MTSDDVVPGELMLVVEVDATRVALRLAVVDRLAEVAPTSVELVEDREVVRLESRAVPLVRWSPILDDGALHLVMCTLRGRSYALVVDRVVAVRLAEEVHPGTTPQVPFRVTLDGATLDAPDLASVVGAPALVAL